MPSSPISDFLIKHYKHFNAATLVAASKAYKKHIDSGGEMMITLAGAMSTAELGISLAEMIRRGKVHIICATGANIEEDIFNLVAHKQYRQIPDYRHLSPEQEKELFIHQYNRVTDTCIPEEEAMRRIEKAVLKTWEEAQEQKMRYFPHEYLFRILLSGSLEQYYQIDPADSWMLAAAEQNIPVITPGWEDSSLGNMFAAHCIEQHIDVNIMKSGVEYMCLLADWYVSHTNDRGIGFFQIGGGIAGDFPICVVPMLKQDMKKYHIPAWSYFCQISDSTTSYGSYSGAVPNEKITWGKLEVNTPKFIIESDASIVAPLIFAYVLGK